MCGAKPSPCISEVTNRVFARDSHFSAAGSLDLTLVEPLAGQLMRECDDAAYGISKTHWQQRDFLSAAREITLQKSPKKWPSRPWTIRLCAMLSRTHFSHLGWKCIFHAVLLRPGAARELRACFVFLMEVRACPCSAIAVTLAQECDVPHPAVPPYRLEDTHPAPPFKILE